jgi:hypothetical protein
MRGFLILCVAALLLAAAVPAAQATVAAHEPAVQAVALDGEPVAPPSDWTPSDPSDVVEPAEARIVVALLGAPVMEEEDDDDEDEDEDDDDVDIDIDDDE